MPPYFKGLNERRTTVLLFTELLVIDRNRVPTWTFAISCMVIKGSVTSNLLVCYSGRRNHLRRYGSSQVTAWKVPRRGSKVLNGFSDLLCRSK